MKSWLLIVLIAISGCCSHPRTTAFPWHLNNVKPNYQALTQPDESLDSLKIYCVDCGQEWYFETQCFCGKHSVH